MEAISNAKRQGEIGTAFGYDAEGRYTGTYYFVCELGEHAGRLCIGERASAEELSRAIAARRREPLPIPPDVLREELARCGRAAQGPAQEAAQRARREHLIASAVRAMRGVRPDWSAGRIEAFARRAILGPRMAGLAACAGAAGVAVDDTSSYLWAACGDVPALAPEDARLARALRQAFVSEASC